jgi:NADP-dependent 3-hydroxy acid dehydrogenase YdfG
MEGLGSDGRVIEGLSIYGSTKRAIRYLTRALAQEASEMPVIVGSLSPGMVVTDLLTTNRDRDAAAWERAKRIYNILGDQVDTVAPWLARRALENERNGARIAWLTPLKAAARFALSPFRQRDLFADR